MIEAPQIELDFFQKLVIVGLMIFGGAIMFNLHRLVDWIRELDNQ